MSSVRKTVKIGIFKELKEGEEIITEGKEIMEIFFVKVLHKRGLFSEREKEILMAKAYSKLFLTNKRLLFLDLYRVQLGNMAREEYKEPPLRISSFSGTWFELPIDLIEDVQLSEGVLEVYYRVTSKIREQEGIFSRIVGKEEKLDIIGENVGFWKVQIEALLSKRKKVFSIPIKRKEGIKYCPKCGKAVSNDSIFCSRCGYRLRSV